MVAYQHVVVKGTPFERGHSHGQQVKQKIHLNIERYKSASIMPAWYRCSEYIRTSYLPAIEQIFPTGLWEMQGIAAGAEVSLEEIVFLNARYDLTRASGRKVGECTSLALHGSDGSAIVAQNWDMAAWLHDLDTIIVLESHLEASEYAQPKRIIGLTEAGQLMRSGMNSRGLGLCANSLWTNEDTTPANQQYLPFTLARAMYLQCSTFAAGLKVLSTFPRHVSGNLMAGSLEIALDLELSPTQKFVLHEQPLSAGLEGNHYNFLTHANHFDHPAMASASAHRVQDTYPGGSSLFRAVRLTSAVKSRLAHRDNLRTDGKPSAMPKRRHGTAFPPSPADDEGCSDIEFNLKDATKGKLQPAVEARAVEALRTAFSDHASFPRSLCEHTSESLDRYGASSYGEPTMTVACVIYDLARGEMHLSKGNPCKRFWSTYAIEMEAIPC